MPTAVGKYGQNPTQEEQNKLLNTLRALAQDAGVIIPEGMDIYCLKIFVLVKDRIVIPHGFSVSNPE
jgi:phage gp29-like protein